MDSNHRPHAYQACAQPPELCARFGGDEEDRTPDPLLAKQVLSQLSYTPPFYFFFFSIFRFLPGILKIEQCLSLYFPTLPPH